MKKNVPKENAKIKIKAAPKERAEAKKKKKKKKDGRSLELQKPCYRGKHKENKKKEKGDCRAGKVLL